MMSANKLLRPSAITLAVALMCMPAFATPTRIAAVPGGTGSPCSKVETGPVVKLSVGKASVLKVQSPVTRILLGNPEQSEAVQPSVASQNATKTTEPRGTTSTAQMSVRRPGVADVDVLLLSPREVYLMGKTVGSTNLIMLDRAGQCTIIDVAVGMDTAALMATLKELLPMETGIKVSAAADSIVLSGAVSDAAAADRALDIASAYVRRVTAGGAQQQGTRAATHDRIINMLAVAAPQQVMVEVKVAEVSKALLDQFGLNFSRAFASADGQTIRFLSGLFGGKGLIGGKLSGMTGAQVGFGAGAGAAVGAGLAGVTAPNGSMTMENGVATQVPVGSGNNATMLGIDAQKQDGLIKVLAEPTVMAISGQEGSFLAGGKVFLPIASNNGTGGTSITLEEREFGVSLRFVPTVLSDGRINLKVSPEVSELNPQGVAVTATNVSGTAVLPLFNTRRASTTVQLMDGQSFAIGGLIKNNVTANLTAFPFLGELPVIGALFRSTSFKNDRSELVFVVTPRLVKPLPADYTLPTDGFIEPSRSDMILRGRLEGGRNEEPVRAEEMPAAPAAPSGGFEAK